MRAHVLPFGYFFVFFEIHHAGEFHQLQAGLLHKGQILTGHVTQHLRTAGLDALRPKWTMELTWFHVCYIR